MKVNPALPSWSLLLPFLASSFLVPGSVAQDSTPKPKKESFSPPPQINVRSPLLSIAEKQESKKEDAQKENSAKAGAKDPVPTAAPQKVLTPPKTVSSPANGQTAKAAGDKNTPASPKASPAEAPATAKEQAKSVPAKASAPAKGDTKPAPAKSPAIAEPVMREPEEARKGAAPKMTGTLPLEPAPPGQTLLPAPGAQGSPLKAPPGAPLANVPFEEPVQLTRTTQLVGSLNGITLFADNRKRIDDVPTGQPQSLSSGIVLVKLGDADGLQTPKADELKELLRAKYLGKPLTFEKLDEIVKDIIGHYTSVGRPTTHVYVPEQEISDRVKIAVLEGRFGEIKEVKNEGRIWYRTGDVMHSVHLEHGDVVDTQSIANAMREANTSPWSRLGQIDGHPFRRVTASFLPRSEELGYTDLKMEVEDRMPVRAFIGYDNTGPALLGEHRANLGAVWYDVGGMGWNHQLGVQFQTDIEFERFHAILVNYQIPILNWGPKQYFQFFGGYMQSSVEIPAGAGFVQGLEGTNLITGLRYHFGLPDWVIREDKEQTDKNKQFTLYHEIGLGLDYKTADNNFAFGGTPVFSSTTNIIQAVLEYNARQTDPMGETALNVAIYCSLGGSDTDYQTARGLAKANYFYARGTVGRKFDLPYHMIFQLRGTVQWASENLLASEQLGLGGFDSVRGYSEHLTRGDYGFFTQLELYSPPMHPLRKLAKQWPDRWSGVDASDDELRFLVFFDYGMADVVNFTATEPGGITMMSTGVGLRYRFNKSVTLRADYGVQLEKLDPTQFFLIEDPIYSFGGDSYAHIGLTFTF